MPPMEVLIAIEHANFPLIVEGAHEINWLHILKAAELVQFTFRHHSHGGAEEVAAVLEVTPFGRAEIERCGRDVART